MIAEHRTARAGASISFHPTFSPSPRGWDDEGLLISQPKEQNLWSLRIDDLLAIRGLQDDWDGMGAKAPSAELVDSAIQLALLYRRKGVESPCRVVPGLTGTVLFEWQSEDKTYYEVEVTEPYRAEGILMRPGQPTKHWVITGG